LTQKLSTVLGLLQDFQDYLLDTVQPEARGVHDGVEAGLRAETAISILCLFVLHP
jgi:hypothetical protein